MNNDIIKVLIYETKQFLGGKMKNLNLLIKPASSSCNLRCRYCFYYDVADNREVKNYGIMNDDTLENMVKKVFDDVEYSANFAFQGGEPTMAGIEFFEKFHKFVEKYNTKKIIVNFSLQTNGTLLNKKWLELFKKHNYLIGLSPVSYTHLDVYKRQSFELVSVVARNLVVPFVAIYEDIVFKASAVPSIASAPFEP